MLESYMSSSTIRGAPTESVRVDYDGGEVPVARSPSPEALRSQGCKGPSSIAHPPIKAADPGLLAAVGASRAGCTS